MLLLHREDVTKETEESSEKAAKKDTEQTSGKKGKKKGDWYYPLLSNKLANTFKSIAIHNFCCYSVCCFLGGEEGVKCITYIYTANDKML